MLKKLGAPIEPVKLSEMSREQLIARIELLEERERRHVERETTLIKIGKKLKTLTKTDKKLTKLANSKALEEQLVKEVARSLRTETPLAVMMLDLDGLKRVNDTLGHDTGDKMLFAVQEVIVGRIRKEDFAAREGGDEFYILMPKTHLEGAQNVGNDIKTKLSNYLENHIAVEEDNIKNANSEDERKREEKDRGDWNALRKLLPKGISISVGIAVMDEYSHSVIDIDKIRDIGQGLRREADERMYGEKKGKKTEPETEYALF